MDKNTLIALNSTNLPDNTDGEISPSDIRSVNEQAITASANLDELTEQTFAGNIKAPNLINSDYVSIGSFTSEATQTGVEDSPKTVEFGAGGSTTDNEVTIDSSGNITINKLCYLAIKQRFRASRSGASGVSELFFWAEVSIDDGVSFSPLGNSVDVALNSSNENEVFIDFSYTYLPVGTILRNRFARSSTGNNSGDLTAATPSATLTGLGVPVAPSAQITIYKAE